MSKSSESAAIAANLCSQSQTQCVQFDEALCVSLIIRTFIILKRHDAGIIQAIGAFATNADDITLIEFKTHAA